MTTVYTVSKPCSHVVLRTLDKAAAVSLAQTTHLILDAIPCRTEDAIAKALNGEITVDCTCDVDRDR